MLVHRFEQTLSTMCLAPREHIVAVQEDLDMMVASMRNTRLLGVDRDSAGVVAGYATETRWGPFRRRLDARVLTLDPWTDEITGKGMRQLNTVTVSNEPSPEGRYEVTVTCIIDMDEPGPAWLSVMPIVRPMYQRSIRRTLERQLELWCSAVEGQTAASA